MKKVFISMMVVLSIFAFSTAALAERLDVSLYRGELEKSTGWVYVNAGNTLHVGVNNHGSTSPHPVAFWVTDSNGKIVTQGGSNSSTDDKAYAIGVPVGEYKLTLRCASQGETPTCFASGWLND
ncbi:hypothetical protein KD050_18775 [Psychrobacillus sp. INOP01]|uniref:hypothetical protein n=1 Tax=Psychrobacillus sp. INOP01 TaxID=2829187 RepID=UPI001BA8D8C6|nr:hypothetical protein [Psychrobacillus sp. INOP01]QUG41294.1 hypothetical protein KD050_18775 [Psychrobacillus sp. INOP01]